MSFRDTQEEMARNLPPTGFRTSVPIMEVGIPVAPVIPFRLGSASATSEKMFCDEVESVDDDDYPHETSF